MYYFLKGLIMMKDDTPVEDDYGDGDIPPVDLPK